MTARRNQLVLLCVVTLSVVLCAPASATIHGGVGPVGGGASETKESHRHGAQAYPVLGGYDFGGVRCYRNLVRRPVDAPIVRRVDFKLPRGYFYANDWLVQAIEFSMSRFEGGRRWEWARQVENVAASAGSRSAQRRIWVPPASTIEELWEPRRTQAAVPEDICGDGWNSFESRGRIVDGHMPAAVGRKAARTAEVDVFASSSPGSVETVDDAMTLRGYACLVPTHNQHKLTSIPGGFVCDVTYGPIPQASRREPLDDMRAAGAHVVRRGCFQSYSQTCGWQPLHRFLEAAALPGLLVIPVLVSQYDDCGFARAAKTVAFYHSELRSPAYGYHLSFEDDARMVAERYASKRTIACWQLVNEVDTPARCASRGGSVRQAFAGEIGLGQRAAPVDGYASIYEVVDLCEVHDYGLPAVALPRNPFSGILRRLGHCDELGGSVFGGSLFVGEAENPADVDTLGERTGATDDGTLLRLAGFSAKLHAQPGDDMDGYLIWENISEDSHDPDNVNASAGSSHRRMRRSSDSGLQPNGLRVAVDLRRGDGRHVVQRQRGVPATTLVDDMNNAKACMACRVPVAIADGYARLLENPAVMDASNVLLPDIYPSWEDVGLRYAMWMVDTRYQQLRSARPGKRSMVSETGWPSCGAANGDAVTSPQQNAADYFFDSQSWAWANGVDALYFEALDESWKGPREPGGAEACWGINMSSRSRVVA